MAILKNIVYTLSLIALLAGSTTNLRAQQQQNRNQTRPVGVILGRLERDTEKFRNSINVSLVEVSIDQTRPQNDVSTFAANFDLAIKQFRNQFIRRLAVASDVENILRQAVPINSFVTRNTLTTRVKSDWKSVRNDLNTLATTYGVNWQWDQSTPMKVDANESSQLTEAQLDKLVQQIENGGDAFRVSLSEAFSQRPYDQTRSEGAMNEAVRGFKRATNQLRIRFDDRQLAVEDVRQLLAQATPLDLFMRDDTLTDRLKGDWLKLRENLSLLARSYDVTTSWRTTEVSQTEYQLSNYLTGTH